MSINTRELTEVCLQLCQEACKIVKDSYMNKDVKKFTKEIGDPVTEADLKIQTLIVRGLKLFFPELPIVGEEEVEFKKQIQFDNKSIKKAFIPQQIELGQQLQAKDLCAWIDPIDCTKGFIGGFVEDSTVLIGISHKGKASIGIVGSPFKYIGEEAVYQPSIFMGSVADQIAYEFSWKGKQGQWKKMQKPLQKSEKVRIATSKTRPMSLERQLIQKINGEVIDAGGAGRKVMMVATGEVQMMIYLKSKTQKWDSCAGEGILKAMGGFFSTPFKQDLHYDPKNPNQLNSDGFLCTFNEKIYHSSLEISHELTKK